MQAPKKIKMRNDPTTPVVKSVCAQVKVLNILILEISGMLAVDRAVSHFFSFQL